MLKQIASYSPTKRKISNGSASSAEETLAASGGSPNLGGGHEAMQIGSPQSIKIDQSYFEARGAADQSLESQEGNSVLNDSSDNDIVEKAGMSKSCILFFFLFLD